MRNRPLSECQQRRNYRIAKTRARVEHICAALAQMGGTLIRTIVKLNIMIGEIKMQQKSFIDLAYENKKKKIRAELFLEKMEKVLPWSKLLKPLRKRYPKGERGRPPIDLEKMLRIYFMQQWFSLGDKKNGRSVV